MKKVVMVPVPKELESKVLKFIQLENQEKCEKVAKDFWEKKKDWLNSQINDHIDYLHWKDDLWQEIRIWSKKGIPVNQKEFDIICELLGDFNKEQRKFLLEFLEEAGLNNGITIK